MSAAAILHGLCNRIAGPLQAVKMNRTEGKP